MRKHTFAMSLAFIAALSAPVWADHGLGHYSSSSIWLVKPLLLATLALGYWVLRISRGDQDWFRWVGQISGWLILLASFAGFVCSLCPRYGEYGSCPLGLQSAHICPHHGSQTPSALPTEKPQKAARR